MLSGNLAVKKERGKYLHTDVEIAPRYVRCKTKNTIYCTLFWCFLVQVLVLPGRTPKERVNMVPSRRGPGGGVHQSGEARGGCANSPHIYVA